MEFGCENPFDGEIQGLMSRIDRFDNS